MSFAPPKCRQPPTEGGGDNNINNINNSNSSKSSSIGNSNNSSSNNSNNNSSLAHDARDPQRLKSNPWIVFVFFKAIRFWPEFSRRVNSLALDSMVTSSTAKSWGTLLHNTGFPCLKIISNQLSQAVPSDWSENSMNEVVTSALKKIMLCFLGNEIYSEQQQQQQKQHNPATVTG